ncbi:PREDICTED: UPF0688 protein C1orf174 homolog, partial [Acanthisitta chloris]|uniref:UPF0688 protein C1orf174 homolog n=1 Tax=Acanthisitta chloris TaxID=57068 RepID=UPI0004F0CC61
SSSHREADGPPAKRRKREKSSQEPELGVLPCGNGNLTALGDTPKASDGDQGSKDPGDSSHHVPSEEKSSEAGWEDRPRALLLLEHSGFSDEDSNQPLPVHRFFGDVEPHLPAVVPSSRTMSRREVRKLHFMAKEDEEEEEDVV